jgi:phosphoglycolate phosphatase
MFRALILDWSGTLVDDMGPTLAATNAIFRRFELPVMTREEFRESFRLPYSEWYDELLPGVPLEELEVHFREAFDSSEHPVTPLEGTAEFLSWCSANKIRLFVLTSMHAQIFEEQLREFGFERHFEGIYSGVIDKRKVIRAILQDHALDPSETAFVGDMAHDIDTAHHGGVTSVGVLSGYDPPLRLAAAGPELLLSNIKSLHALMEQSNNSGGDAASSRAETGDRITINRLAVECMIGVPEAERAQAQSLYLSISMVPVQSFASLQDRIENTVDYDAVARRMREVAKEGPRHLIETLAADLARMVVEEFAVREVRVEIEKHILPDTDAVTVATVRRAGQAAN